MTVRYGASSGGASTAGCTDAERGRSKLHDLALRRSSRRSNDCSEGFRGKRPSDFVTGPDGAIYYARTAAPDRILQSAVLLYQRDPPKPSLACVGRCEGHRRLLLRDQSCVKRGHPRQRPSERTVDGSCRPERFMSKSIGTELGPCPKGRRGLAVVELAELPDRSR